MRFLVVLSSLSCIICQPIDETATKTIVQLQKDIDLVAYVQNFKNAMAEYVNSQYKNLTIGEMEAVKQTLEEFLKDFAKDLRDAVEGKLDDEEKIEDGLNDLTFDEIKKKIAEECPEIDGDVAEKIVLKLRKNLYQTRHKLDKIIRDSQIAAMKNAE